SAVAFAFAFASVMVANDARSLVAAALLSAAVFFAIAAVLRPFFAVAKSASASASSLAARSRNAFGLGFSSEELSSFETDDSEAGIGRARRISARFMACTS